MNKVHIVRLNDAEREQLTAIVTKFSGSSQKVRLLADKVAEPSTKYLSHRVPAPWSSELIGVTRPNTVVGSTLQRTN